MSGANSVCERPCPAAYATAAERAEGSLCLRSVEPADVVVVRHEPPDWRRYGYAHLPGEAAAQTIDRSALLTWIDRTEPELVACEDVERLFDGGGTAIGRIGADGGTAISSDGRTTRSSDGRTATVGSASSGDAEEADAAR